MTSIIKLFNAKGLNYTLTSSGGSNGCKEEDAFSNSSFFTNSNPSYWQITFSQPVAAESYQICPNVPTNIVNYVSSWKVSYSTRDSLTLLQIDNVSSRPSGAVNFSFSEVVPLKTLRITCRTTNNGGKWLRVGQFDLFGTLLINSVQMNLRKIKQKIIRNATILMMPLTNS